MVAYTGVLAGSPARGPCDNYLGGRTTLCSGTVSGKELRPCQLFAGLVVAIWCWP